LAASRILSERYHPGEVFVRGQQIVLLALDEAPILAAQAGVFGLAHLSSASRDWRMMWNLSNRIAACGASSFVTCGMASTCPSRELDFAGSSGPASVERLMRPNDLCTEPDRRLRTKSLTTIR